MGCRSAKRKLSNFERAKELEELELASGKAKESNLRKPTGGPPMAWRSAKTFYRTLKEPEELELANGKVEELNLWQPLGGPPNAMTTCKKKTLEF